MRFFRPLGIFLILSLVSLLLGCMSRMTVKETAHYKLYEDMNLLTATLGTWTKTDIHIPNGAIVAVMAKGEVWNTRDPRRWHWQPYQLLRFKVGEDGREINIGSGIDSKNPSNLNTVASEGGGFLYFGMAPWWKVGIQQKQFINGKFTARVIVWEKGRQDRIENDLLDLIRSHPGDRQFSDLVAPMAGCLSQTGEYEKVQNLHKMIRETPEIDWTRVYPQVLNTSAYIERLLGRNDRAKAYSEEALKRIKSFGNRYMESSILRELAYAAIYQKQYDEANLLLEESLKIAKELKNPELIGTNLRAIGENLLRMNKPAEAVEYLEEALRYLLNIRDPNFARRWCYLSLGECYTRISRNMEAKNSFESAIEVGEKAGDPQPQWRAHSWLGWMAAREMDNLKAFEHYAKAITIIESMRGKFTDPGLKTLFMRDKLRVYERMIQLLYRMKRTPEALHYLERARARIMLDMLAEKTLTSKNKEENELLNQERALRKRIDDITMKQEEVSADEPQEIEEEISKAEEPEKRISELERLQAQHRGILERIEKLNSELASLVTINPLKAGEIQGLLDGDTVLLEYFMGMESRFIFLVTRDKVMMVPLKIDLKNLFQRIREFRVRAVEGITLDRLLSKIYERPLSDLYRILIQPIEREISGKKNLVIVPHGMTHYLPFQALLSKEGKFLIESFNISYLPSATVLKYARAKNKGNRVDLFAIGNPATGLSPLPAAEVEVREVSAFFEKKLVLTGQQATKTSVKGQGPKYDMMLLSTHGEMIGSNPLKSNLRFTPSGSDDGRLTVNEIFDMEIKANLVTLSACETALVMGEGGDFPQGDDLVGLSRAFIHAGTPSVVASLWKVSDDSTVKLMRAFYQNMKSMPKAEALRKAQMDLMRSSIRFSVTGGGGGMIQAAQNSSEEVIECSHPFFWAPFILLGDWR